MELLGCACQATLRDALQQKYDAVTPTAKLKSEQAETPEEPDGQEEAEEELGVDDEVVEEE